MKSLPPLVIQSGKCIMRMDSIIWNRWKRYGTKTLRTSSKHHGSMWLTRSWWSGTIILPLGLCVLVVNNIRFSMMAIQYAVGLPIFCGGWRLSRGVIYRHIWAQIFTQILEEPFYSCFLCVSLYFIRENLLLWKLVFVLQMGLLQLWQRECMSELLSISVVIGQKLFQGIS